MTDQLPMPAYIDDLTVREVYAETAQTLFGGPPGMLRLEFCVTRWTQQPPIHADRTIPVARVALGMELAKVLRDQLSSCIELAEKRAQLVHTPAATPTKN